MRPLFPNTKRYGCNDTTPPETDTLLLNVAVTVAEAVALLDIVTVVPTTETTVVFAGIPAPVIVCPAPIRVLDTAKVRVGLRFVVVTESVKTPIWDMLVPVMFPIRTGVSLSESMA
jgi:hypothetical protein